MSILVTGGNGFIGKNFVGKLENVEIYDLPNDILDIENLRRRIRGKDIVWHFAAIADLDWAVLHEKETFDVNVQGTINVARICAEEGVKLNYISTGCVYGNQKSYPTIEESLPNPAELYASTKLMGEEAIKAFAKTYGLRYNIARIATIYGEGMRSALGVHIFFSQSLKGVPITVHGDGLQIRQQTYIDDLIEGLVLLHNWHGENETFNFCADEGVSAIQMAKDIKRVTETESEITHVDQRKGQVFIENISSDKAKNILGWKAKTPFKEGLLETYEYIKKEYIGNNTDKSRKSVYTQESSDDSALVLPVKMA